MPAAAEWRLDGDVIVLGELRVSIQRIASSHWQPDGRLRSWGQVPMHRDGDTLLLPCAADESLWLGAWLEEDPSECPAPVRIAVRDPASGASAVAALPDAYQLGALHNEGSTPEALQIPASGAQRRLALELEYGTTQVALELVLLPPTAWSARAGRPSPPPLDAPPPLPPRLG